MADETLPIDPNSLKTCLKCGIEKPCIEFPRNRAQLDGFDRLCKTCMHTKNREQYEKHRETRRASSKIFRKENSEKIKEEQRAYRESHRGKLNEYLREYRKTHKSNRSEESKEQNRQRNRERYRNDPAYQESVKASSKRIRESRPQEELNSENKAWRDANPGKTREYYLRWKSKRTPEELKAIGAQIREKHKIHRRASNARYTAKRSGAPGELTNTHIYALHKWQDHCCFYCRENMKGHDTLDHVVPLAKGGTNNPYNIVLACLPCNSYRKQDHLFAIDWMPEQLAETPRFHSLIGILQLKKMLDAENIEFVEHSDHMQIRDRHIFVLSSFWLGWRGNSIIKSLAEKYDRPILLFDKELAAHPNAFLNVLKAKAGIALKIGARKLTLAVPLVSEARDFIGQWHALGFASGTHYLGLRDSDRWWGNRILQKRCRPLRSGPHDIQGYGRRRSQSNHAPLPAGIRGRTSDRSLHGSKNR